MKKLFLLWLAVVVLMVMWGCGKQPTPLERAMSLYQEFLASDNPQAGEESLFYKDEWKRYAFFDMNGDGIPELHIHSQYVYNIVTCRDGELHIWKSLNTCAEPLNNGAVLAYKEYDFFGNEKLKINFGKFHAQIKVNYMFNTNFNWGFPNPVPGYKAPIIFSHHPSHGIVYKEETQVVFPGEENQEKK